MSTIYHVHLDVRGALKSMTDQELDGLFHYPETGLELDAAAAREVLLEHLEAGRNVIPLGPRCEGFDYAGGGCPGHAAAPNGEVHDG